MCSRCELWQCGLGWRGLWGYGNLLPKVCDNKGKSSSWQLKNNRKLFGLQQKEKETWQPLWKNRKAKKPNQTAPKKGCCLALPNGGWLSPWSLHTFRLAPWIFVKSKTFSPRLAFEMNFNFLSAVPGHPAIHNHSLQSTTPSARNMSSAPHANRRTNEVRDQNKKEESKIKLN